MYSSVVLFAALISAVRAAQPAWAQCGGQGWTGDTTCTAGFTCTYGNPWYSQCVPTPASSASAASASPSPATSGAQAPWAQCGGQGWTGGTTCTPGWTCTYGNPWYSQCKPAPASSTAAASPSSVPATGGTTYKSTFTFYGAGDSFGSPNCNTNTAACGFYTYPGFSAAASQNLYGVGPGAGAGPACGTCWKLTIQTDSSGNKLSNAGNSITVMINNLCPADGNPLCSQNGMSGTNQYGANVNFDLCRDSGASAALFQNTGVGLGIGTAQQVNCNQYSGTVVH